MVACCRCNKTGSCQGCACSKAGKKCVSCCPMKLKRCLNTVLHDSTVGPTNATPPATATCLPESANVSTPTSADPVPRDNVSSAYPNSTSQPQQPTSLPPLPQSTADLPATQPSEGVADALGSDPILPTFEPMSNPVFTWGSHSSSSFIKALDSIYSEVVHWRRNSFTVPFGKVGKEFTSELSRLFLSFASASALESIALKAATVLPILLLQKPHRSSKAKVHSICLEERLKLWRDGNLDALVVEGRAIQKRLPKTNSQKAKQDLARAFANLMFAGKTKAALDLLSNGEKGGVLHLADPADPNNQCSPTVREVLNCKHPTGQPAYADCILSEDPQAAHPIVFDSIDAKAIRSAALQTNGSAGPSGIDAHGWRRLCTSFKGASNDLCTSLALVAKRLCTDLLDPKCISPLLACRLIALDKCPGVRPIGIGDTARRIIAKAILFIAKPDVQDASGCLQMCGGQISGIEAAVHAVRSAFERDDCEGVILADASNAFNSLNRQVALHNIQRLCPPLATILINTYRSPTELFVDGDVLFSQEGTTQGDPLAMPMYALATIPLIRKLEGDNTQVWYADDAAAAGKITALRKWWDELTASGPKFGYFPNASKSWLVTKQAFLSDASSTFAGTGVNVTPQGRPHLGAALGSRDFVSEYVANKVEQWVSCVQSLASIAKTQPHAAFSALTHGLISKWTYLCRITPDIGELLLPLDNALRSDLLPMLTGRPPPNDVECSLFALPARLGGLGIMIPSKNADREHQSSLLVTEPLCDHILSQNTDYSYEVVERQMQSKATVRNINSRNHSTAADTLLEILPDTLRNAVDLAKEKGASSWLTVLPLKEHGFTLHKGAFHDALALRYGWPPSNLPSNCACGSKLTVEHAFSCAKGGFPSIRHNEIRDLTATLLTEVCNNVSIEPELQPATDEKMCMASANTQDGARLDIAANGFWGGSFEKTMFDVRVFNPYAPSNKCTKSSACYRKHEKLKKRTYEQRVRDIEHASFTPLVLSATGGLANEANTFYKRLASMLASKWDQPYSCTLRWLRCRLGFSLLRSAIQSIRGARSSRGHAIKTPTVIDLVNSESHIRSL